MKTVSRRIRRRNRNFTLWLAVAAVALVYEYLINFRTILVIGAVIGVTSLLWLHMFRTDRRQLRNSKKEISK